MTGRIYPESEGLSDAGAPRLAGTREPGPATTDAALRVTGLSHLAVVVRDLAIAERFYVDLLGLEVITRHADEAQRHRSTWVRVDGDSFLAIERASLEGPLRHDAAPGHHCLAVRIARVDRDRWVERLEAHGVIVERRSPFTLYVRDPDGALVALSHYPEVQPAIASEAAK